MKRNDAYSGSSYKKPEQLQLPVSMQLVLTVLSDSQLFVIPFDTQSSSSVLKHNFPFFVTTWFL